ncbi:MAG TPA: PIG-L family deacetylase [Candidatus Micrarchaeaceae archaeon]|nr:PIG-L family deacetylase [Candidatus Micrarchaeaceae archaeon]
MASNQSTTPDLPTPSLPSLELFEYVPERALVVVAHPDDSDFLAAAVLSAWSRRGCRGAICMVTDGDAGSDDATIPVGELSRIRLEEQRSAAQHLGVSSVHCLGYPDGMLQNTLAVRRDLVRLIRQLRPEAVITMDPSNRWFGRGYINHPDHRAAGDAALDAIFPSARDSRAFPELLRDEGLQPHKVRFVFVGASSDPDIAIPLQRIDLDNKMAALGEHRSQFDASDMREGMERGAREVGRRCGVEFAESYRFFDLVPNPSQRAYRQELQDGAAARQAELLPPPPEPATDWG